MVGKGEVYAIGEGQLSSYVTETPLTNVRAEFIHESERTEANLFALDPTVQRQRMGTAAIASTGTFSDEGWDAITQVPDPGYSDATWPATLVLPYPNAHLVFPPFSETTKDLELSDFWLNADPAGLAADPDGGAVRAAWVYDHGLCSRETKPESMMIQSGLDAWYTVVDKTDDYTHSQTRLYMNLATWLDAYDDPQNGQQPPTGGFFINTYLSFDMQDPLGVLDLAAAYQYEVVLDEGLVKIDPFKLNINADGDIFDIGYDETVEAFEETTPGRVNANLFNQQTVRLTEHECTVGDPTTCADAATALGFVVTIGTDLIGGYANEEVDAMVAVAEDTEANWACVPDVYDLPGFPGMCEYIVRGKRLNHYVDAFEVVWFDGKEVDNPAYVLWVAANVPPPDADDEEEAVAQQIATLCSWSPPSGAVDDGTWIRVPVSVDLGVDID
ncbi:MAG: hypothetical protein WKG00_30545 [Polyangiaceae bacterium]